MTARLSRRHAFGTGAAFFLIAASEAGAAKAAELDGALIEASTRLIALQTEFNRVCEATGGDPDDAALGRMEELGNDMRDAGEALAAMAAKTPEGLQAKARAILAYFDDRPAEWVGDDMLLSLARDVAGRAGA